MPGTTPTANRNDCSFNGDNNMLGGDNDRLSGDDERMGGDNFRLMGDNCGLDKVVTTTGQVVTNRVR